MECDTAMDNLSIILEDIMVAQDTKASVKVQFRNPKIQDIELNLKELPNDLEELWKAKLLWITPFIGTSHF